MDCISVLPSVWNSLRWQFPLFCIIDDLDQFNFEDFGKPFLWKTKKEVPEFLALVNDMHYNFEGEDDEKDLELFL